MNKVHRIVELWVVITTVWLALFGAYHIVIYRLLPEWLYDPIRKRSAWDVGYMQEEISMWITFAIPLILYLSGHLTYKVWKKARG